jgi:chromate transporter
MTILVQLALTFLGVAFFSIGGASALIPEFHRQIVGIRGWMTDADFAHMVALAQVAPGPNMLIVSLIGWRVAGFPECWCRP